MTDNSTLYVDLDGTLIRSDLLIESFMELIRHNILFVFLVPFWLLRGKAWLKEQIASRVVLRADLLPYNTGLIDYLKQEKAAGRRLVLISASNQQLVNMVHEHLDLFDTAYGSTSTDNLSGSGKLHKIQSLQNGKAFAYAGNASVDIPIWEHAEEIIAVDTGERLRQQLQTSGKLSHSFQHNNNPLKELVRALRPHQWLKNTLLLLPLLLLQQAPDITVLLQTAMGFVSFCLCASSVYLLNDLLDLPADRQHFRKRNRPFASGSLDLRAGLVASPALLLSAFAIAWLFTPIYFVMILGLYYLSTLIYSFAFKRIVLVDVITLATLYTLRIIAGAAAIPVIPSFWLLAFSMFIFMSLAIVKRYTELAWLRESGITHSEGRGYLASDLDMMAVLGSSSAFMSVLVFALYINSDDISRQYTSPEVLWFICPLMLYLLSRIWLLAHRGELEEDPVVFALRDRISQLVVLGGAGLLFMATIDWRTMLLI